MPADEVIRFYLNYLGPPDGALAAPAADRLLAATPPRSAASGPAVAAAGAGTGPCIALASHWKSRTRSQNHAPLFDFGERSDLRLFYFL
jgi:hypothetical protein